MYRLYRDNGKEHGNYCLGFRVKDAILSREISLQASSLHRRLCFLALVAPNMFPHLRAPVLNTES